MSAAGRSVPGATQDVAADGAAEELDSEAVRPQPRTLIRTDLRAALVALVAVAVAGIPLGVVWSLLAPPEVVAVLSDPTQGDGGVLPFVGQSEHRFDGLALFVLIGIGAGIIIGAALWQLRRRRGPVLLLAGVLGSLAGAWIAMRIGVALAGWHYSLTTPTPLTSPTPLPPGAAAGTALSRAPVLESYWGLVAQPFGVAITYSFAVAWNGTPDLDRPEPAETGEPVQTDEPAETG
ncbi:MAG TPA: DUF2567 domain-containing protein [Pseudonocardiaceae bacterium]|jgi:hypothetical protein